LARIPTRTPLQRPLERPSSHSDLGVSPRWVALTFLLIAGALWVASPVARLGINSLDGFPGRVPLVRLFYLDNELNVGTWYSSFLLALDGVLLALITLAKISSRDRHVLGWAALSLIFLYLSLDETASLHEISYGIGEHIPGPVYVVALIPALAVTSIAALAFLRFLAALPQDTRRWFLIAAALLVGGAVGVEIVNGWISYLSDHETALYVLTSSTEETMEVMGEITFLYALMLYAATEIGELRVSFSPSGGGWPLKAAPGGSTGWRAEPANGPGGDGQS
jgi:hypothetical protein